MSVGLPLNNMKRGEVTMIGVLSYHAAVISHIQPGRSQYCMTLLKDLKHVQDIKGKYFHMQQKIYKELSHRYPMLIKYDMDTVAKKLEEELQLLFCACLKFKSVIVKIPGKPSGYRSGMADNYMGACRSMPGFYNPGSQRGYSDLKHMDMDITFKEDDNLYEKECSFPKLRISELRKNNKQIYLDRLETYIKLAHEVMAYRPNMISFDTGRWGNKGLSSEPKKIGGLLVTIKPESFTIELKNERITNDFIDIFQLLAYSETEDFSKDLHERLKLFILFYDDIKKYLNTMEKKKRIAVDTCKSFLSVICQHTTPFKVLKQLTKKC